MKNYGYLLTKYPLTMILVVAIWVVCLIPIPETPLSDVKLIDKWTHLVLYGGLCSVAWMEYGWRHQNQSTRWLLIWFVLVPLLMGGLIEVAQATCTGGTRSGDVLDWIADAVGVGIGQVIGIPLSRLLSRLKGA